MNGYICFFKGKRIEVYADTAYQAQTKAREIFKPSKKDMYLISVTLAELNGQQVTHVADH